LFIVQIILVYFFFNYLIYIFLILTKFYRGVWTDSVKCIHANRQWRLFSSQQRLSVTSNGSFRSCSSTFHNKRCVRMRVWKFSTLD